MKRIGTREEVFRGLAERTSGGMRKQDIMIKNNKFISRKKSDRMKIMVSQNERFQTFRSNKKTRCNNNLINQQNKNTINRKPIKRTQKKVVFHFNKNKVQEYNCPNLGYYCGDEEDEEEEKEEEDDENNKQINFNRKPRKFKIEKINDINIDDLF